VTGRRTEVLTGGVVAIKSDGFDAVLGDTALKMCLQARPPPATAPPPRSSPGRGPRPWAEPPLLRRGLAAFAAVAAACTVDLAPHPLQVLYLAAGLLALQLAPPPVAVTGAVALVEIRAGRAHLSLLAYLGTTALAADAYLARAGPLGRTDGAILALLIAAVWSNAALDAVFAPHAARDLALVALVGAVYVFVRGGCPARPW